MAIEVRSFFRTENEGLTLFVKLVPNAKRDEIIGIFEVESQRRLGVRVRAVAEKNKANKSLCTFISTIFHVAQNEVELVSGNKSRFKKLYIRGNPDDLTEKCERLENRYGN